MLTAYLVLVFVPLLLLLYFGFFAAHNYANSVGSLRRRRPPTSTPRADARVAVVIVSFNERAVIADTVRACERLTYPDRTVIVGDDSDDPETLTLLRDLAAERGCTRVPDAQYGDVAVEVWESEGFVLFHRNDNEGFKAGNLKALEGYLKARGFDYMYLLDADWRPQPDVIERCLEVIEADPATAFVQTKRLYHHGRADHFQRCLAINEEACYTVDLPGRQALGQMILFSGCCTLFDLAGLYEVGGFRAGHLTEDIDLSNRFYLAGYQGAYVEDAANVGEVPPNYQAFRRQQERWAIGSARTFKEYFLPVLRSRRLSARAKWSLIRQNAYYTVALGMEISLLWSVLTAAYLGFAHHRGTAGRTAVPLGDLGHVTAPLLVMTLLGSVLPLVIASVRQRDWVNLLYIPPACWIALSIVHTYAIANVKGFRNVRQSWFVTPKTNHRRARVTVRGAWRMRALNAATLVLVSATYLAAFVSLTATSARVLVLAYAILWIPSMLIGALRS